MTPLLRNSAIILLIGIAACKNKPTTLPLPFINKPDFTPEWINKGDSGYSSIHTIPSFSFTDQDGQTVTEKTVEGKIYVADFYFYQVRQYLSEDDGQYGHPAGKIQE